MIDLSTFSRPRLCARVVKLEALGALSRLVSDALADRLVRVERENRALYAVLARQVVEHTELRRQLANVTPLSALAALRDAPGWQSTTPTAAEVSAHGRAFPYGPHEGTDDDYCAGLWALRDEDGISLVDVCVQAFEEGDEVMVRPVGVGRLVGIEEQIESTVHGATGLAWLRLTADGRPVVR